MRLNVVLNVHNFREHSLFPEFLEHLEESNVVDPDEGEEYTMYEMFLTWLEDL